MESSSRSLARVPESAIFPPHDYHHRLKLARGEAAAFFGPWDGSGQILEERRRWLREAPERHAPALPTAAPLIRELIGCAREWGIPGCDRLREDSDGVVQLGEILEADFVLLTHGGGGGPTMVAGCVCFPSSWAPETRLGLSLAGIHGTVPDLNAQIGPAIQSFLGRLQPGVAWLRANWGLSASPELNQHPGRGLPRLESPVRPEAVWVRVEHQALVALPSAAGVLFGIRVEMESLARFRRRSSVAAGLAKALETMPGEMARYKGLAAVRKELVDLLTPETRLPESAEEPED